MSIYPAQRFIRMMSVMSGWQPSYAPNEREDALEAYAPFLHASEADAVRDLAGDMLDLWDEVKGGDRDADEVGSFGGTPDEEIMIWTQARDTGVLPADAAATGEFVQVCDVHEDGRIESLGFSLTRAEVFEAYGVEDPRKANPGP